MPKKWENPNESIFHYPQSDSPTINICDAMIRKTNLLYETFRGNRVPDYMTK